MNNSLTTRVLLYQFDSPEEVRQALHSLGAHQRGIEIMLPKSELLSLKLLGLSASMANVLKQEALSVDGEAAVNSGCITATVEQSDALLFVNLKQLRLLIDKLKAQHFPFQPYIEELEKIVRQKQEGKAEWRCRNHVFDLQHRVLVMGILNVTPDSFSDGGIFVEAKAALAQVERMVAEGADLIDIGGESTRPGAQPVSPEEEWQRVGPLLETIKARFDIPLSLDTHKEAVARQGLALGVEIINDITALRHSPQIATLVAEHGAGLVLMHMQGSPRTMQHAPQYEDVVREISEFLAARLEFACAQGVAREQIVVDPGIGFGKDLNHNLDLLRQVQALKYTTTRPVLVGLSRKSFLGKILNAEVGERLEGSLAAACFAVNRGAAILRVHDVGATRKALRVWQALRKEDRDV